MQGGKVGPNEFETAINLLDKILARDSVEFAQIRNLVREDAFKLLLRDKSIPARLFAIKMIKKAAEVTGGPSWLVNEGLMELMVEQWLRGETEVSTKMEDCLYELLTQDYKDVGTSGRLWREFFENEANYQMILEICSWRGHEIRDLLRASRSISQHRLLSLCAKLCRVNTFALISPSKWPELFGRFANESEEVDDGGRGLLGYAIRQIKRQDSLAYAGLIETAIAMLDGALQCQNTANGEGPNTNALRLLKDLFMTPEVHLLEDIYNTFLSAKEHVFYVDHRGEDIPRPFVESSHLTQLSALFIAKYASLFVKDFGDDRWYTHSFFTEVAMRRRGDDELTRFWSMKQLVFLQLRRKLEFPKFRMTKASYILLTGLPIQYFVPDKPDNPLDSENAILPMISIHTPGPYPTLALAHFFRPPSAPSLGRLFYGLWLAYQRKYRGFTNPYTFFQFIHSEADQPARIESCSAAIQLWKTFVLAEEWKLDPPRFITRQQIEAQLIIANAVPNQQAPWHIVAHTGLGELIALVMPLEDIIRLPNIPGHTRQNVHVGDPVTNHDTDVIKMLKERYYLVETIRNVLLAHYSNTPAADTFLPRIEERLRNGVEGYDQGRAPIGLGTELATLYSTQ